MAADYDAVRYQGPVRRVRNAWHTATLARAFRDVPQGATVLDLPCGTGRLTPWLLERGYRVLGLDASPAMLAQVPRRPLPAAGRLLGLAVGDASRIPLAADAVDVALVVRFLHLLEPEQLPGIYRELARVARSRVILSVNGDRWAVKHVLRRLRGRNKTRLFTRAELAAELAAGGLRLERLHRQLPWLSTVWVAVCAVEGGASPG